MSDIILLSFAKTVPEEVVPPELFVCPIELLEEAASVIILFNLAKMLPDDEVPPVLLVSPILEFIPLNVLSCAAEPKPSESALSWLSIISALALKSSTL